jgi:hypothetical protein
MSKMGREKIQMNKISNEKGEITTNPKEIHGIISDYFENLYLKYIGKYRRNEQIYRHI